MDRDESVLMWHGARAWDGSAEIRSPSAGRAEMGAGIYCTTHYETARKYAKGGGVAMELRLSPDLRLLEDIQVSADLLVREVARLPGLSPTLRSELVDDIRGRDERGRRAGREDGLVGLNVLVNLLVNSDAAKGRAAVAVTEFVASQGADASLNRRYGQEDWLVVYNPAIIHAAIKRPAAGVLVDEYVREPVREQLQRLEVARQNDDAERQRFELAGMRRG